jgi:hypothetical protein
LIIEALPVEIQARIQLEFGNKPPVTHPFPYSIDTLFVDIIPIPSGVVAENAPPAHFAHQNEEEYIPNLQLLPN